MKITDITVYLAKEWRTFLFVVVDTDEGIYGVGEAGITGRELAVAGAVEHFKPLLIGEDPFRIEHHWQRLYRGGFYPAGPIMAAALSAIDIALWDIKGKAFDTPVYNLFGGYTRDRLLTYNHLHGATKDELVDAALKAKEEGWKAMRFEPVYNGETMVLDGRDSVRQGIKQWEAVRAAVGEDIELCYDMHTRLNLREARYMCRALEEFRPFFIEDALRSEQPEMYRHLRQHTAVPLAAGEQYTSKWAYRTVVEEDLIDFARLDVCIGGGLTESLKIAGWCETHNIDIAVHNPIGPIATAACYHLNMAISNFGVMELPKRPGETMADVVTGLPDWEDGYLLLNDRPGLGVEFNREALEHYPFEITELPHVKRPDGSFTNW